MSVLAAGIIHDTVDGIIPVVPINDQPGILFVEHGNKLLDVKVKKGAVNGGCFLEQLEEIRAAMVARAEQDKRLDGCFHWRRKECVLDSTAGDEPLRNAEPVHQDKGKNKKHDGSNIFFHRLPVEALVFNDCERYK